MFPMTALLLIKGDQRNLKKVTDTGVGAGDKEESLVKLSRVEFDQTFLLFNIESVRFPPRSPVAVFLLPPPENLRFAVVPEGCFLLHTVEPVSGQEFLSRVPFPITEFNFIHKVMAAYVFQRLMNRQNKWRKPCLPLTFKTTTFLRSQQVNKPYFLLLWA